MRELAFYVSMKACKFPLEIDTVASMGCSIQVTIDTTTRRL